MFNGDHLGRLSPRFRSTMPNASALQGGFTFIGLMLAMLVLALGTQRVFVSTAQQKMSAQKLMQTRLLKTYNLALLAYRDASPGTRKQFPLELKDLLLDKRQLQTRRYLRKLYGDPFQPGVDPFRAWGFVRDAEGRIVSMFSIQINGIAKFDEMP